MTDSPATETEVDTSPAEPPKRRRSLFRSFSTADFITLANASAGMGAVLFSMAYLESGPKYMWFALGLLPLALICDVMDGYVARWKQRSSPYGADLDSLADVISFGVAPAVIGYALGLKGSLDLLVLLYFVVCGVSRLARFNVTAESLTTSEGKVSHFEGTPIPTSLLLVAVLAIAFAQGAVNDQLWLGEVHLGPLTLHPLVLMYALSGSAMVATSLKIPKP